MGRKIYLTIISLITVFCIIFGCLIHFGGFFHNIPFMNFSVGNFHIGDFSLSGLTDLGEDVDFAEELEAFSDLDIDMDIMDVTITSGNSYAIEFQAPERLAPEFEMVGNRLHVYQDKIHNVNIDSHPLHLTITIPRDAEIDLTCEIDVGDFLMENVSINNLDVACDVGDMEIQNTSAKYFKLSSDVGDVRLDSFASTDGEINCDVGDIKANFTTDLDDTSLDLRTDVGDVKVNGQNYRQSYTQKGTNGDEISFTGSIGDVELTY
ncbi:MAG: DUF4097 family beta strand repeat-containing protein [Agathobacter sp.]|nr:DUF4097 family beta strand repeat-containing protein [Agathobacter sp.]